MKLNVLFNNTPKMVGASSGEVRKQLIEAGGLPSVVARQIVGIALKHGVYNHEGLRIVAVGHEKFHAPVRKEKFGRRHAFDNVKVA